MVHSFMLGILVVLFLLGFGSLLFGVVLLDDFFVGLFDFVVGDPFIISAVQGLIMHVVLIAILSFGSFGVKV